MKNPYYFKLEKKIDYSSEVFLLVQMVIAPKAEIPKPYYTERPFIYYIYSSFFPGSKSHKVPQPVFPDFACLLTSNRESQCFSWTQNIQCPFAISSPKSLHQFLNMNPTPPKKHLELSDSLSKTTESQRKTDTLIMLLSMMRCIHWNKIRKHGNSLWKYLESDTA